MRTGQGRVAQPELGVAGDPPLEPSTGPRPLDFGPWPPQRRENESVVLSLPACGRGSGSARSWSSGPVPGTTPCAGSQRADALAGRGGVTFIICVTAPNPTPVSVLDPLQFTSHLLGCQGPHGRDKGLFPPVRGGLPARRDSSGTSPEAVVTAGCQQLLPRPQLLEAGVPSVQLALAPGPDEHGWATQR